jgi:hypothetical protein
MYLLNSFFRHSWNFIVSVSPQIFSLIVKSTDGKWNMKPIIIFYWRCIVLSEG